MCCPFLKAFCAVDVNVLRCGVNDKTIVLASIRYSMLATAIGLYFEISYLFPLFLYINETI